MSETMGRCRSEVDDCYGSLPLVAIAEAIDRLAEDVAAIKAAILPQTTEERDAAIRERDEARALLKLVQVQRTAAYADRDQARADVYRLKCSMTETSKVRDAAIRERDEARAEVERLKAERAAREAADVQPIGWIARHNHAPPVGKYVMCRWDVEARQGYARQVSYGAAKRGPDGMWLSPTGVEKIAPMHWMPLPPGVEGGDEWEQQPPATPPPVVEVPAMPLEVGDANTHTGQYLRGRRDIAVSYRAALDKAGISWKAVGRE